MESVHMHIIERREYIENQNAKNHWNNCFICISDILYVVCYIFHIFGAFNDIENRILWNISYRKQQQNFG